MNKKAVTLGALFAAALFFVAAHSYNQSFHKGIKSKPQYYCYDYFSGVVNPAFIVTSESFTEELVAYYQLIEKNPGATPYFRFPLKVLPQREAVYLPGYYDKDSNVAEVYSYYTLGAWYNGHLRGYVYAKTLHKEPPLLKDQ